MAIPSAIPPQEAEPALLETPRLLLRKPVQADAPVIFEAYAGDAEVTHFLTWKPHARLDETRAWLLKVLAGWEEMTTLTWMITTRSEQELIGAVELRLEAQANLGFVLSRRHWNRGFMTEAVQAVIAWARTREEVERVWALCAVENTASARVLEKAGMEREGLLRSWLVFPNVSAEPQDCYRYSQQV
jgi:ribosomal-protein-alanine N-acetyltransferase